MEIGGVEQLRAAIDALAAADVVGVSQRDELVALWRELTRLEAQFARRRRGVRHVGGVVGRRFAFRGGLARRQACGWRRVRRTTR